MTPSLRAPRRASMAHLMCGVQIVHFEGGKVDFSPERSLTPGEDSPFPPKAAQPGSVGAPRALAVDRGLGWPFVHMPARCPRYYLSPSRRAWPQFCLRHRARRKLLRAHNQCLTLPRTHR